VTKWSRAWSKNSSVGLIVLATCVVSSATGCSKKKDEDAKAQAEKDAKKRPQGDRYADGQRLSAAAKDWTRRWGETADLPACDPLLKDAAELELCKNAGAALTAMKAAAAKPEAEAVLIHDAAELAFTTEAASEKLRNASMEKMQAEQKAAPLGSASGAAKAPSPPKAPPPALAASASVKARALSSAAKAALADKLKPIEATTVDPAMQVMQAYSRVNRASLRYLSQFLQFGPLPTRKATFVEVEALSKRREVWPALGRTLREAAMAENDPELQGSLKALAPKLSRRSAGVVPTSPNMPGLQGLQHPPADPAAPPPKGE
jgi:hypothetical protein